LALAVVRGVAKWSVGDLPVDDEAQVLVNGTNLFLCEWLVCVGRESLRDRAQVFLLVLFVEELEVSGVKEGLFTLHDIRGEERSCIGCAEASICLRKTQH